jgi:hypothetical protein
MYSFYLGILEGASSSDSNANYYIIIKKLLHSVGGMKTAIPKISLNTQDFLS